MDKVRKRQSGGSWPILKQTWTSRRRLEDAAWGAAESLLDRVATTPSGQSFVMRLGQATQSSLGAGNFDPLMVRSGEIRLIRALNQVLGPLRAIDIGANTGSWTLAVLSASDENKVIAIEPAPHAYMQLEALRSLHTNLWTMEAAVGNTNQQQVLYVDTNESELSSLSLEAMNRTTGSRTYSDIQETSVQMLTLESVMQAALDDGFGIASDEINFVKIDTEGTELAVIQGLNRAFGSRVDAVQFEFNGHALAQGTIIDDFQMALGDEYELLRLAPRSLLSKSHMRGRDSNVFAFSNWLAIRSELLTSVQTAYRRN